MVRGEKREANGRVSRKPIDKQVRDAAEIVAEEWEAMATAIMARWRVHGVPMSQVRDQMAGSYIGRLCLSGELSRVQYDAGMAYLAERHDYHVAIAAPKQMGAVDLNAVHGRNNGENVARSVAAVERYEGTDTTPGIIGAIRQAQEELGNTANLWAAIDLCLIRDVELPHMVGDLRLVLNALARHFGLENRRAA